MKIQRGENKERQETKWASLQIGCDQQKILNYQRASSQKTNVFWYIALKKKPTDVYTSWSKHYCWSVKQWAKIKINNLQVSKTSQEICIKALFLRLYTPDTALEHLSCFLFMAYSIRFWLGTYTLPCILTFLLNAVNTAALLVSQKLPSVQVTDPHLLFETSFIQSNSVPTPEIFTIPTNLPSSFYLGCFDVKPSCLPGPCGNFSREKQPC